MPRPDPRSPKCPPTHLQPKAVLPTGMNGPLAAASHQAPKQIALPPGGSRLRSAATAGVFSPETTTAGGNEEERVECAVIKDSACDAVAVAVAVAEDGANLQKRATGEADILLAPSAVAAAARAAAAAAADASSEMKTSSEIRSGRPATICLAEHRDKGVVAEEGACSGSGEGGTDAEKKQLDKTVTIISEENIGKNRVGNGEPQGGLCSTARPGTADYLGNLGDRCADAVNVVRAAVRHVADNSCRVGDLDCDPNTDKTVDARTSVREQTLGVDYRTLSHEHVSLEAPTLSNGPVQDKNIGETNKVVGTSEQVPRFHGNQGVQGEGKVGVSAVRRGRIKWREEMAERKRDDRSEEDERSGKRRGRGGGEGGGNGTEAYVISEGIEGGEGNEGNEESANKQDKEKKDELEEEEEKEEEREEEEEERVPTDKEQRASLEKAVKLLRVVLVSSVQAFHFSCG